jgi:hypothetical protein
VLQRFYQVVNRGGPAALGYSLTVPPRASPESGTSPARRIITNGLLVVTTVLAVAALLAVWADRQLLAPGRWANTSTELLRNQKVRSATAQYLTDQLYDNLDVAHLIGSDVPAPLQGLAASTSGALRRATKQGIELALAQKPVQGLWSAANRVADEELVAITDGGGKDVAVNQGKVTLNLRAILNAVGARLGLGADLGNQLPASAAELTILRSDQLKAVQRAGRTLRRLALVLSILVPLLYLLAIAIARGRRRRILLAVGASAMVAGIVVLAARAIAIPALADSLAKEASVRPAAQTVISIATSMLRQLAEAVIVGGALVVIVAWLAGWARRGARRRRRGQVRTMPGTVTR